MLRNSLNRTHFCASRRSPHVTRLRLVPPRKIMVILLPDRAIDICQCDDIVCAQIGNSIYRNRPILNCHVNYPDVPGAVGERAAGGARDVRARGCARVSKTKKQKKLRSSRGERIGKLVKKNNNIRYDTQGATLVPVGGAHTSLGFVLYHHVR